MLNEERIKLMTKMAAYEADEGKKNVAIGNYFIKQKLKTKSILFELLSINSQVSDSFSRVNGRMFHNLDVI